KWDWSVLQETINLLFNDTEIDPEKMLKGKPRYEGYYLQLPGMGWYALGKGIRSRYKDDSVIHEIIACMERFAGKAQFDPDKILAISSFNSLIRWSGTEIDGAVVCRLAR